jgi:hypothetical protein
MTGRRLGLLSLRLDALYCTVLGTGLLLAAPRLAAAALLPTVVVAAVGGAVLAWAASVVWMAYRLPLRPALRVVTVANVVAALGLAGLSAVAAGVLLLVGTLAIAVDVGVFAGSQALALRRLRAEPA